MNTSDAFQESFKLYKTNHLPFPPIPTEYSKNIVKISEWVFGTRTNARSPYATNFYIEELQTDKRSNYTVFGHAGHGIMSYGLHFYLVKNSLALFLQHSWGNADSDPKKDVEIIEQDYLLANQLILAVDNHPALHLPKQLVVYQSNLRSESRWALSTGGSDSLLWNRTKLGQALETVLGNINDL